MSSNDPRRSDEAGPPEGAAELARELEDARRAIARARTFLAARSPNVLGGPESLDQRAYRLLTEAERLVTRMLNALREGRWRP